MRVTFPLCQSAQRIGKSAQNLEYMESIRVVTTAEVTSKPFSYNDVFVVTIVGLGKKVAT